MKIKFRFKKEQLEECKWFYFKPKFEIGSEFTIDSWGYFDPRPSINTKVTTLILMLSLSLAPFTSWWLLLTLIFSFFSWGRIQIKFPIDTGKSESSNPRSYGLMLYHPDPVGFQLFEYFWIRLGKKSKLIDMPWVLQCYRTSILALDETWIHEFKGKSRNFWDKEYWDKYKKKWYYMYTDNSDGEKIPTVITVEEREWRRKGLFNLRWFNRIDKFIYFTFKREVGNEKNTWKGGVISSSYKLVPGESPIQCIKRMEKERKF